MAPTTRSAARSAAESAADDKGHAVLRVLLEHPVVGDNQELVCRLLACSKAVGEAAAECWSGRLKIWADLYSVAAAESLGPWVARHGGLVGDMYVAIWDPLDMEPFGQKWAHRGAATAAFVAGLSAAPAGCLRNLHSLVCGGEVGLAPPLSSLPRLLGGVGGLTQLDVDLCGKYVPYAECAALAALTGLHSICFAFFSADEHAELIPALESLSMLTRLSFAGSVVDALVVQGLPCSLRALCFTEGTAYDAPSVELSHLTALTCLVLAGLDGAAASRPWALPPSLVEVSSCYCYTPVAPLLGLANLTSLAIRATPHELAKLHALSSLACLSVDYDAVDARLAGVLEACEGLPLRDLDAVFPDKDTLAADAKAAALPRFRAVLGGLEELRVDSSIPGGMDLHPLARLLRPLKRLRVLRLGDMNISVRNAAAASDLPKGAVRPVVQALLGLPCLERLLLMNDVEGPLTRALRRDLASATQLAVNRLPPSLLWDL